MPAYVYKSLSQHLINCLLCVFANRLFLHISFDTPIVLLTFVLSKPTELSEFTFHRRCLEARHALLGESLALVEELSTLRDVRPFSCHLSIWGQRTVYPNDRSS